MVRFNEKSLSVVLQVIMSGFKEVPHKSERWGNVQLQDLTVDSDQDSDCEVTEVKKGPKQSKKAREAEALAKRMKQEVRSGKEEAVESSVEQKLAEKLEGQGDPEGAAMVLMMKSAKPGIAAESELKDPTSGEPAVMIAKAQSWDEMMAGLGHGYRPGVPTRSIQADAVEDEFEVEGPKPKKAPKRKAPAKKRKSSKVPKSPKKSKGKKPLKLVDDEAAEAEEDEEEEDQ